jgi:hypothetical protein
LFLLFLDQVSVAGISGLVLGSEEVIRLGGLEGYPPCTTDASNPERIATTTLSHGVIEMGHDQVQVRRLGSEPEEMEKDERIQASRDGDDDALTVLHAGQPREVPSEAESQDRFRPA